MGSGEHEANTSKSGQASCVVGERMLHIEEADHPHDGEANYVPRMRDPIAGYSLEEYFGMTTREHERLFVREHRINDCLDIRCPYCVQSGSRTRGNTIPRLKLRRTVDRTNSGDDAEGEGEDGYSERLFFACERFDYTVFKRLTRDPEQRWQLNNVRMICMFRTHHATHWLAEVIRHGGFSQMGSHEYRRGFIPVAFARARGIRGYDAESVERWKNLVVRKTNHDWFAMVERRTAAGEEVDTSERARDAFVAAQHARLMRKGERAHMERERIVALRREINSVVNVLIASKFRLEQGPRDMPVPPDTLRLPGEFDPAVDHSDRGGPLRVTRLLPPGLIRDGWVLDQLIGPHPEDPACCYAYRKDGGNKGGRQRPDGVPEVIYVRCCGRSKDGKTSCKARMMVTTETWVGHMSEKSIGHTCALRNSGAGNNNPRSYFVPLPATCERILSGSGSATMLRIAEADRGTVYVPTENEISGMQRCRARGSARTLSKLTQALMPDPKTGREYPIKPFVSAHVCTRPKRGPWTLDIGSDEEVCGDGGASGEEAMEVVRENEDDLSCFDMFGPHGSCEVDNGVSSKP